MNVQIALIAAGAALILGGQEDWGSVLLVLFVLSLFVDHD